MILDDDIFWVRFEKMIKQQFAPLFITELETNIPIVHKVYDSFNTIMLKVNQLLPESILNKTE